MCQFPADVEFLHYMINATDREDLVYNVPLALFMFITRFFFWLSSFQVTKLLLFLYILVTIYKLLCYHSYIL